MFDSIGWGEILVLALGALFIFGPDRLPSMAKDAGAALRQLRAKLNDVHRDVDEHFGGELPDLRQLDLRRYHPKTFLRDHLWGEESDTPETAEGGPAHSPRSEQASGA